MDNYHSFIHFHCKIITIETTEIIELHRKNDSTAIFSYFRFVCKVFLYQNFVQQANFTGFVHVKGALGL
jgi:hypothetical protein